VNKKVCKTPRGHEFKNNNVRTNLKKIIFSNKKFEKKYENELGNLSMKLIDRTLVETLFTFKY
jgi:hypothetical protein